MQFISNSTFSPLSRLVALLLLSTLAACGGKVDGNTEKGSQSVARVNGDEITVHQINNELQRANVQPGQQEAASKQVVQMLIDRQIAVQQALESKLDRNPRVLQALENARAQILSQAFIEEKVAQIGKPTDAEIAAYRSAHPEIFAQRRVYLMDDLTLPADAYSDELKSVADSATSIEAITKWLDGRGIKYRHNRAAHAAETLPKQLVTQLAGMVVGDNLLVRSPQAILVSRIVEIKEAPISEADSKPLIERILQTEKRKAAAEGEMKRLRAEAKVVYLDKKYEPAADGKAQPAAEPVPAPEAPAAAEPAKAAEAAKPANGNIEKGLKGL